MTTQNKSTDLIAEAFGMTTEEFDHDCAKREQERTAKREAEIAEFSAKKDMHGPKELGAHIPEGNSIPVGMTDAEFMAERAKRLNESFMLVINSLFSEIVFYVRDDATLERANQLRARALADGVGCEAEYQLLKLNAEVVANATNKIAQ